MKLRGVVKGKTIELEANPELPDGQRVLVELEIPTSEFNVVSLSSRELEDRITTDPAFETIRQARMLRERITTRLGVKPIDSVDLIREDRSR